MNLWELVSDTFSPHEAWGDPARVSGLLVLTLYALREVVDMPFVIHCAYDLTGHAKDSQHPLGNAVDFNIDGAGFPKAIRAIENGLVALQIENRVGLGLYPQWERPGFHLDVRGVRARWGKVGGVYVGYEQARIEAHGL